jgi:hypothetical protein
LIIAYPSIAFHPPLFQRGVRGGFILISIEVRGDYYFQKISLADKCCNFLLAFFAT